MNTTEICSSGTSLPSLTLNTSLSMYALNAARASAVTASSPFTNLMNSRYDTSPSPLKSNTFTANSSSSDEGSKPSAIAA